LFFVNRKQLPEAVGKSQISEHSVAARFLAKRLKRVLFLDRIRADETGRERVTVGRVCAIMVLKNLHILFMRIVAE
jgi:hypothetical protein